MVADWPPPKKLRGFPVVPTASPAGEDGSHHRHPGGRHPHTTARDTSSRTSSACWESNCVLKQLQAAQHLFARARSPRKSPYAREVVERVGTGSVSCSTVSPVPLFQQINWLQVLDKG